MFERSRKRLTKSGSRSRLAQNVSLLAGAVLVAILIAGGLVRAQDGASLAAGSATILGDNSQPVEPNPSAASSPEAGFGNAPQGGGLLRDQFAPTLQNAGGLDSAGAILASPDLARKLGLSPDQLAGLKNRLAGGQLSPDDVQQLCLRFAARQLAPSDVQAIAGSLGINLTDQQLAQLQSCTTIGGASTPQLNEAGSGAAGPSRTAAMPPPELSSIERSFHTLDSGAPPAAPSAANLSQFGYALFDSRVSTFAPVNDVPVGRDYVIGPGDELKALIWGRVNDKLDLTVQRDGSVLIPEIGPLQVAGLTFEQAKKLIELRGEQITGVQVDVTMGRLRTIPVFVMGEVQQPGAYTISALAHVSNVLAASGGITKVGTLRRIELRRDNQVVKVIDLYGMLLYGDTSQDLQLEPNDVIFVPVIGNVTAVAGDVKRPGIYELARSSEGLDALLRLAGGISAFGYAQRVQVERVADHAQRIALDVDLNQLKGTHFTITDGDLVKVYPVLPEQKDVVVVHGNVNRPGNYQWYAGMRVGDLLRQSEGVASGTFFRYALIRRLAGPDKAVRLVPVDLGAAIGENGSGADVELQSQDSLTVFSESEIKDLPTVQIFGEVRNPGFYVLDRAMRVSDLVYLAGGLKDDAYTTRAELARTQVINGSNTSHSYVDINLHAALDGTELDNPVLAPNDQLFVRRATDWHLPWVVQVKGQVVRPGPYSIHEGERLASLLERCGGMLPDAYPPGAIFLRQSVKEIEQKRLNEARQQLQEAIARYQLMPAALEDDKSSNVDPHALEMLQQVLDQTESQQAQGRLVIRMQPIGDLVNSEDNVVLEDQDEIVIPRRPSSVNVLGRVYSPNAIVYDPSLKVRDYLERAGGPAEGADTDHIFVVKADGSILTDEGLKNSSRSTMFPLLPVIQGGLMGHRLEPGDTVFVPEKLVYPNKVKLYSNIAQIFASTAQTLGIFALAAGL
jgi:protein involved in polysaccharide export with SLBB domain